MNRLYTESSVSDELPKSAEQMSKMQRSASDQLDVRHRSLLKLRACWDIYFNAGKAAGCSTLHGRPISATLVCCSKQNIANK